MTVRLRPLILWANFGDGVACPPTASGGGLNNSDELRCPFCGMNSGRSQNFVAPACTSYDCSAACVLCFLCRHLERPRIDEEAILGWLPEMSQPALNVTMREIHVQLRALGEDLYDAGRLRLDTPERLRLYYARSALSARGAQPPQAGLVRTSRASLRAPSSGSRPPPIPIAQSFSTVCACCRLAASMPATRTSTLRSSTAGARSRSRLRFRLRWALPYPPEREHILVPCPWFCEPVARPQAAADRVLRAGDGAR